MVTSLHPTANESHLRSVPTPADNRVTITGAMPDRLFPIPVDDQFVDNETEFLPADEVRAIGEMLIEQLPEFGHLRTADIEYVFKRKGGATQGKQKLAFCAKTSGMTAYFSRAQFVIWIAADVCREFRLNNWQMEALIYHELLHADIDAESAKPAIRAHDVEAFHAEIGRYGLWRSEFRDARDTFAQAALPFDALAYGGAA